MGGGQRGPGGLWAELNQEGAEGHFSQPEVGCCCAVGNMGWQVFKTKMRQGRHEPPPCEVLGSVCRQISCSDGVVLLPLEGDLRGLFANVWQTFWSNNPAFGAAQSYGRSVAGNPILFQLPAKDCLCARIWGTSSWVGWGGGLLNLC